MEIPAITEGCDTPFHQHRLRHPPSFSVFTQCWVQPKSLVFKALSGLGPKFTWNSCVKTVTTSFAPHLKKNFLKWQTSSYEDELPQKLWTVQACIFCARCKASALSLTFSTVHKQQMCIWNKTSAKTKKCTARVTFILEKGQERKHITGCSAHSWKDNYQTALSVNHTREHSGCPGNLCFVIFKSQDFVVYKHSQLSHCISWDWYDNAWRLNHYLGKASKSSHPSSAVGKCTEALSTWKANLCSTRCGSKQDSAVRSQQTSNIQWPLCGLKAGKNVVLTAFVHKWLQPFRFRTQISWSIFKRL